MYIKCSIQCPQWVCSIYLLTCNQGLLCRGHTYLWLGSCHLSPHLPAHLCSLCSSHHVSVAERTEPTHSHPRAFALAVLSVPMLFLRPPGICMTASYSAFWSQPQCHRSLTIVPGAIPHPIFSHHYIIFGFIFFVIRITFRNDLSHILLVCDFYPTPDVSCMQTKNFVLFHGCRHHS